MGLIFLLGAGASQDAGLAGSFELGQRLLREIQNGPTRYTSPRAVQALRFVYAQIVANDAATRQGDPLSGFDVERLVEAVRLLASREQSDLTPFVREWEPAVEITVEQRLPAFWGDKFVRALTSRWASTEIERLINQALVPPASDYTSQTYANLAQQMLIALRRLVALPAESDLRYLDPVLAYERDDGPTYIASLNYDLAVETRSSQLGLSISTGIAGWIRDGRLDWEEVPRRLLKLHGSINWSVADRRNDPRIPLPEERLEVSVDPVSDQRPPAILFGNGGKLTARGPYLDLLSEFRLRLDESEDLVVIGYSFRDEHVNELIRRWINRHAFAHLHIVNPAGLGETTRTPDPESFAWQIRSYLAAEPVGDPSSRLSLTMSTARVGLAPAIDSARRRRADAIHAEA